MTISIIIVSYNTSHLLEKCLLSLFHALKTNRLDDFSEVIVVDNASKDDSVSMMRTKFPRIRLLSNNSNKGFAKANNQAFKIAKGKLVLLLNSDTVVQNSTIETLIYRAGEDENIGVIGGRIHFPDRSLQPSVGYFPNLFRIAAWMLFLDDIPFLSRFIASYHVTDPGFYTKRHSVDWVTGACLLVRNECIKKTGGFDENIFMYGEEVEWCYRIKKLGYSVEFTPESDIIHLKGASSGIHLHAGIVEEIRTILYIYQKHKPVWQLSFAKHLLRIGAWLRMWIFGIIAKQTGKSALYAQAIEVVRR